jgi:hypothetical protein
MRDRFGRRERRAERLQLRGTLPVLALEHVTGGHRGARGIARRNRTDQLVDLRAVADERSRLRVLAHLQVRVLHEVV